jgi:hypothetical protein
VADAFRDGIDEGPVVDHHAGLVLGHIFCRVGVALTGDEHCLVRLSESNAHHVVHETRNEQ